jgi:U3 small nucleolar RNA-associated protein 5
MSTKRKTPSRLGQPAIKPSAKALQKVNLDESKAAVFGGGHAIKSNSIQQREIVSISSDASNAEEDDDLEDSEADSEIESVEEGLPAKLTNGDVDMEDAGETDEPIQDDGEEAGEPSFGDLVRANAEPIDVAAFDPSSQTLAISQRTQLQPPSGASLGIVLTQALRTNDVASLETCLQTSDINTIRATIQRLDSPLAGTLLHKLAERLHRRPGRAGSLMVWVQWTLVTHGGYLATQPDLIKRLAELNRVIDERSKSLQSLLSLKGKLDMLEAQITLRRSMQDQRQRVDDDDDEGIIYVEGQESEDEDAEVALNGDMSDMESEMSEDMPMANGIIAEIEDSEEESDDDDDNLIDDEAEETDDDEEDVDHDDQDSESGEESDDAAPTLRPSKMQRLGGLSSKQ